MFITSHQLTRRLQEEQKTYKAINKSPECIEEVLRFNNQKFIDDLEKYSVYISCKSGALIKQDKANVWYAARLAVIKYELVPLAGGLEKGYIMLIK